MKRDRLDYIILVIGLGSMGKRRIRNLQAIGFTNIFGYDLRSDRKKETKDLYNITIVEDVNAFILKHKTDAFVISVPPDAHHTFIKIAMDNSIHFFVEASVVDDGMEECVRVLKKQKYNCSTFKYIIFSSSNKKNI